MIQCSMIVVTEGVLFVFYYNTFYFNMMYNIFVNCKWVDSQLQ